MLLIDTVDTVDKMTCEGFYPRPPSARFQILKPLHREGILKYWIYETRDGAKRGRGLSWPTHSFLPQGL